MKLVKSHSNCEFFEDFGLQVENTVHFYEGGKVTLGNSSLKKFALSPVNWVNIHWMDKSIKIKCGVADTTNKKRIGLQGRKKLADNEGLYFPYIRYSDVSFHQGSVPYSLDILFIGDDQIIKIMDNTKVGSKEPWKCQYVEGVIEVLGGFCKNNSVDVGDDLFIHAISDRDLLEFAEENRKVSVVSALSVESSDVYL